MGLCSDEIKTLNNLHQVKIYGNGIAFLPS